MGTPIDLEKLRSIGVISRRTRDHIREGRRPIRDPGVDAGQRCKATTDELGNTVVESANRQDVQVKAPHVRMTSVTTEERT
jgi:hypothetical protein